MFGGSSSGTSSAASNTVNEMLQKYGWSIPLTLVISIIAFIGFILAVVALILFSTAKSKKRGRAAAILAIISGVSLILIPVELIGGIKTLRLSDEEFAYRRPKKKKGQKEIIENNPEEIE